jgi:hypothetical protein
VRMSPAGRLPGMLGCGVVGVTGYDERIGRMGRGNAGTAAEHGGKDNLTHA